MLYQDWRDAPFAATRWPNFSARELACKCGGKYCGGEYWHDPDILDRLQALRNKFGPLHITSGHRCRLHNAAVGGAPHSRHKRLAVDIALNGHDRFELRDEAIRLGFNGIGMAVSFLHLDQRKRPAGWYYGARSRQIWTSN